MGIQVRYWWQRQNEAMKVAVVGAIVTALVTALVTGVSAGVSGLLSDGPSSGGPQLTATTPAVPVDPPVPSSAEPESTDPPTPDSPKPTEDTDSSTPPPTPASTTDQPVDGQTLPSVLVPAINGKIQTEGGPGEWAFDDSATVDGSLRTSVLWVCGDLVNGNFINCAHDTSLSWAELTLSKQYRKFTALLGFADKSASACSASVRVLVDNRTVLSRNLKYGDYLNVSFDIKDRLKLRVENRFTSGGVCFVDFADATYIP